MLGTKGNLIPFFSTHFTDEQTQGKKADSNPGCLTSLPNAMQSSKYDTIPCGRQNIAPIDLPVIILGTSEYVTINGKRQMADPMKLRIWRWEDDSESSVWG